LSKVVAETVKAIAPVVHSPPKMAMLRALLFDNAQKALFGGVLKISFSLVFKNAGLVRSFGQKIGYRYNNSVL